VRVGKGGQRCAAGTLVETQKVEPVTGLLHSTAIYTLANGDQSSTVSRTPGLCSCISSQRTPINPSGSASTASHVC
jgi:hypothetical protein